MTQRSKKATTIYITELDYNRLSGLIDRTRESNGGDREYLNKLETELDRAEIVAPKDVPANVVTMRSQVRLKDLVSGESNTYSLVFPTEADFARERFLFWPQLVLPSLVTGRATPLSGRCRQVCES
jgi:regulator of nucleoside diphosphate kinase